MAGVARNNHDDIFMNLLLEDQTIIGFFYSIFGFLARRTDFYVQSNSNTEGLGFPPGVAEEIVVKVLRKCDPFASDMFENSQIQIEDNVYMPTAVAEEVEIETTETVEEDTEYYDTDTISTTNIETEKSECNEVNINVNEEICPTSLNLQNLSINCPTDKLNQTKSTNPNIQNTNIAQASDSNKQADNTQSNFNPDNEIDPSTIPESQRHSESYNGAIREHYNWSQKIAELDVTVKLPAEISSSKNLKVDITSSIFNIQYLSSTKEWSTLINDKFPHKIKAAETLWTMSEGKLRIHLEKQAERWWTALLENEPKIDTSRIDCSRPLDELPEEHVAKVREVQWNQMQKLAGKPTSDEIKRQKLDEIWMKAWNMPGSPFANTPYDPSILS